MNQRLRDKVSREPMPVQFLRPQQRASYGKFVDEPSAAQVARFFHLDDADCAVAGSKRGAHNSLGFSALGLVVNIIVLWNTIYMDAVLAQLQREGYPLNEADVARLSPFIHEHINPLGRYSFAVPDEVARGEQRRLRGPEADLHGVVRSIHGGPQ